jgi:hypothetical protein
MIFTATRFENGVSIRCEADNIVMRDDMDRPIHDTLVLEVMCKWLSPMVIYERIFYIQHATLSDFQIHLL